MALRIEKMSPIVLQSMKIDIVIKCSCLQEDRAPVETDSSACRRLYGRAELGDLLCPYVFSLPCR
jgi:hypothetical protein